MTQEKLVPKLRFRDYSDDWFLTKISEICMFVKDGTHGSFKDVEDGIPLLSAKDISDGHININEDSRLISIDDYNTIHKNYELEQGDILLTIVGTIGRTALVDISQKFTLQRSVAILRVNKEILNKFVYYYIQAPIFQKRLKSVVNQSAQGGVYLNSLKKLKIKISNDPSEQEKISNFLSTVDKKIELLTQKHQYYKDFKKYLMQQIFAQKLRFDNHEWEIRKIGDIFDERSEKGFDDLELLSVTINKGVIKRSEIEDKDNSSDNKSNYKHVLPGDIVYNSMRMWQGASGVSDFEGIVSPAYTILTPSVELNPKFFGYYFKTHKMLHKFTKYSQGLTSDTWNLKYPLISEISIKIPSVNEQNKFTNFLSSVDKKISIIQKEIGQVEEFKKGLLQQMFV